MDGQKFTFEDLEQYLDGQLPEEKAKALTEQLQSDDELSAQLDKHRQVRSLTESYAQARVREEVGEAFTQYKRAGRMGHLQPLRIAAAVLLVLVGGWMALYLANPYSNSRLANRAFEAYPDRVTTMSDGPVDDLRKALEAYNQGKYDEALKLFSRIEPENDSQRELLLLYTGICRQQTGDLEGAAALFENLIETDSSLSEAARWYLSLAYLQLDRTNEARRLLEIIVRDKDYNYESANNLLNDLDSPLRMLTGY